MKSLLLSFILITLTLCTYSYTKNNIKKTDNTDSLFLKEGNKEYIPLPDSLGGELALGDVTLIIYKSKCLRPQEYDVQRIYIRADPCNKAEIYGKWTNYLDDGGKKEYIYGQATLNRFQKWIDESYKILIKSIDTTSRNYFKSDSTSFGYIITVNPTISSAIDSAIQNYTIPKLKLPDKLGGKRMVGYCGVRILINSAREIKCWFPWAISVTNKLTNVTKSYLEGNHDNSNDDYLIKRFSPWISSCLAKVEFKIDKHHRLFKEFESIPVDIFLKFNSKKIRHKDDSLWGIFNNAND